MNYHGVGPPLGLEHVNNWSERKDINSEIEDIGTLRRYSHVSFVFLFVFLHSDF